MTIRICNYCQQDVPTAHLEELRMHGINVHFCVECQTEYLYWSDGALAATHFYVSINSKLYRWSIYPIDGVRLWYFEVPGISGVKPNRKGKVLIHFTHITANVSPKTVEEKIRNILLFL